MTKGAATDRNTRQKKIAERMKSKDSIYFGATSYDFSSND